jgi:hypothetical protein
MTKTSSENSTQESTFIPSSAMAVLATRKEKSTFFYLSSLSITGGTFHNNYAFGAGIGSGDGGCGGAIFLSSCSIAINYPQKNVESFKENRASSGGAIAALYSNIMCSNAKYVSNQALKYGGAVYLQGHDTPLLSWVFNNVDFITNFASEIGGAIVATSGIELYCQSVLLDGNSAGISGGSCYIINTQTLFFDCDFMSNMAGNNKSRRALNKTDVSFHIGGRGGGAIYFMSGISQRLLYTQSCCFNNNSAVSGTNFVPPNNTINPTYSNSPGNIIMFNGLCKWLSSDDAILTVIPHIGHVSTQWNSSSLLIQYFNVNNHPICGYYPTYVVEKAASFSHPSPKRDSDIGSTAVPSPSLFTYNATPLTPLPLATTESWIKYPSSIVLTNFISLRTFQATSVLTPRESPQRTLERTPKITATFKPTPVKTLEPTPIATPSLKSGYEYSVTYVKSMSMSSWNSEITTYSYSQVLIGGSYTASLVQIFTFQNTFTYIEVDVKSYTEVAIKEYQAEEENVMSSTSIIIIATVSSLAFFLILGIAIFIIRNIKHSSSSGSPDSTSEPSQTLFIEENLEALLAPFIQNEKLTTTEIEATNEYSVFNLDDEIFINDNEF